MEFLKKTAEYLLDKHSGHFNELCVVLPNRRAAVFLKKHISSLIKSPVFLPGIISIQDFIIDLSETVIADEYTLLIELYKSYATVKKDSAESFDEFLKWGNKLLQDFDEIDQHLADARFIFTYLKEEKNLALWALDHKPLSDFQVNYLNFYSILYEIYTEFTARMQALKLANYGMACRKAVENINNPGFKPKYKTIVFTGINALTKSEEQIVNYFETKGLSEMLWDADAYYIDNKNQEAGAFIRKYLKDRDPEKVKWISNNIATEKKEIRIIGVSGNIGQVKFTADEIKRILKDEVETENISIILNEEGLLIPLLNSIPNGIDAFNITMGFPLKLTPIYNLIELIFNLHQNSEKFRNLKNSDEPLFYHKDLQKLFSHNYFSSLLQHESTSGLISLLAQQKKVFYTRFQVDSLLSGYIKSEANTLKWLFEPWQNESSKAIACLLQLIGAIRDQTGNSKGIEIELLFAAYKILMRLKDLSAEEGISISDQTLQTLFTQNISQATVPFVGEPLKGLQIMGMLETRALDFDTIFMLSVNEGILPKNKTGNSFIPNGIRIDSGLPTYKQNEQIFAYHFYRLLQGCRKIYLLYNTQPDDIGGGERSRFINQLIYELPKYNPAISISVQHLSIQPVNEAVIPIVIQKNDEIIAKLQKIAQKGLSPSALNSFRKCKLQYYFNYIAEISEPDELSEIIDQQEFGTYLHAALEKIFAPLAGKEISVKDMDLLLQSYESIVKDVFEAGENMELERMSGKNLLIYHVIKDYLRDFLEKQSEMLAASLEKYGSYSILSLEKKFEAGFTLNNHGGAQDVKIIGKIDRIDLAGDQIQIIDYKSGSISSKNFFLEKLLADEEDPKNDFCFQLMLYQWLWQKDTSVVPHATLQSGIVSFRQLGEGIKNIMFSKDAAIDQQHTDDFETFLTEILNQLFDASVDFVQTSNEENCRYCAYKVICMR
jgi:ATP-dependent helicase/nuclease subunit B